MRCASCSASRSGLRSGATSTGDTRMARLVFNDLICVVIGLGLVAYGGLGLLCLYFESKH